MPRQLRIAVAGLGRIGWYQHCKSLARHADFNLTAVCDPEKERREEAERELGVTAYESYEKMIAHPDLNAVVIATPTHFHKAMALAAFRRDLHVMLEKPMAMDLKEARAIFRAAKRARRKLTVYQPHRVAGYFQHLMKVLAEGKIGRIVRAQLGMFTYARRDDWQSLRQYGGGMLNNYAAHGLDQLLQIIGYDIRRLFCQMQVVASLGDAEDVVKIILETRKGVMGDLDISQASVINPYRINIWGTCGALTMDKESMHLRYFDPCKLPQREVNPSLASAGRKYPSEPIDFVEETVSIDKSLGIDVYTDFARAIRKDLPPVVRPEETLALMETMQWCRDEAGEIVDMR